MPEKIDGLPDGMQFVRIGAPKEDEFELLGGVLRRGVRPNAVGGLIVKPAEGYTFQPQRLWDIRSFSYVDGEPGVYTVVKQLDPVDMKVTASFVFTNQADRELVNGLVEKVKDLPGCSGVTIE